VSEQVFTMNLLQEVQPLERSRADRLLLYGDGLFADMAPAAAVNAQLYISAQYAGVTYVQLTEVAATSRKSLEC